VKLLSFIGLQKRLQSTRTLKSNTKDDTCPTETSPSFRSHLEIARVKQSLQLKLQHFLQYTHMRLPSCIRNSQKQSPVGAPITGQAKEMNIVEQELLSVFSALRNCVSHHAAK
jgi:hypothetical protein